MATTSRGQLALVLEDDHSLLRAVNVILNRGGYKVLAAESATQVIRAVERVHPELVVVDLALAGTRGVRLLSDIVTTSPRCPIVVLSPLEALRESALNAGAVALVDVTDLRPLEWCLHHLREGAHVDCDCCPATADDRTTSIAFDPRASRVRADPRGRRPWSRYYGPTPDASSTASSAGSHRRKPPPS